MPEHYATRGRRERA